MERLRNMSTLQDEVRDGVLIRFLLERGKKTTETSMYFRRRETLPSGCAWENANPDEREFLVFSSTPPSESPLLPTLEYNVYANGRIACRSPHLCATGALTVNATGYEILRPE